MIFICVCGWLFGYILINYEATGLNFSVQTTSHKMGYINCQVA